MNQGLDRDTSRRSSWPTPIRDGAQHRQGHADDACPGPPGQYGDSGRDHDDPEDQVDPAPCRHVPFEDIVAADHVQVVVDDRGEPAIAPKSPAMIIMQPAKTAKPTAQPLTGARSALTRGCALWVISTPFPSNGQIRPWSAPAAPPRSPPADEFTAPHRPMSASRSRALLFRSGVHPPGMMRPLPWRGVVVPGTTPGRREDVTVG